MNTRKLHLPTTTLCLALVGCFEQELELGRQDGGAAPGEPHATDGSAPPDLACLGIDKLDVLFVIDNSHSMEQEQQQLSVQIPKLAKVLTSGDINDDGVRDFRPVGDMHLGVVSTDMGTSGLANQVAGCDGFGDDGVLIRAARGPACQEPLLLSQGYLRFAPGEGDSADQVAEDFSCLASLGDDGCGFEQPLEAMYKAVAPASVRFGQHSGGHGDGLNAGFLRDDATLVVVHVSDEEDCSMTDRGAAMFVAQEPNADAGAAMFVAEEPNADAVFPDGRPIGINLRCALKADDSELIHSVDRFVDGLKQLKPDHPENIVFAAIVGIPPEAEGQAFDDLLAHPKMQYVPDPSSAGGGDPSSHHTPLIPACTRQVGDELLTKADPGRRFVATAKRFGDNGIVRSICAESYDGALGDVIERVANISRSCTR